MAEDAEAAAGGPAALLRRVAGVRRTVIGAVIVAPLGTPIMGVALAVVVGDARRLWSSAALVLSGAAAVVLIGAILGCDPSGVAATHVEWASDQPDVAKRDRSDRRDRDGIRRLVRTGA